MPAWGGGGTLITSMPTAPWPKSIELKNHHLAAANTNPWNATQQIQDWQVDYKEGSISYASLTQTQAQAVITFLEACNGIVNVFQFPAGLAAKYPETFTSDGTTQRYWRLKTNDIEWSIKVGSVYNITYEIREAT
jgi:hypothetical protein